MIALLFPCLQTKTLYLKKNMIARMKLIFRTFREKTHGQKQKEESRSLPLFINLRNYSM